MELITTDASLLRRIYTRLSDFFCAAAYWLVPLLWIASAGALFLGIEARGIMATAEWSHLATWLALSAIGINSHALVRHMIARLTEIIALWQEDVHVLNRDEGEPPQNQNVVPILRTVITHRPHAHRPTGTLNSLN